MVNINIWYSSHRKNILLLILEFRCIGYNI